MNKREREREAMIRKIQEVGGRFFEAINRISSIEDAKRLADAGPAPGETGRKYYSNLDFFLTNSAAPSGASTDELRTYLHLITRCEEAGTLPQKVGAVIRQRLATTIEDRQSE